jgi:hypothetical protein
MRIVSAYFDNMFKQGSREAIPNPIDGLYHVSAVGFHPEAMKNLLNVTLTKTKAIPKTLAFHMLVHVAVMVDYYDMREAMTLYTGL